MNPSESPNKRGIFRQQALHGNHKRHDIVDTLERGQKTVAEKLDHQAVMFSTETASTLVEFAEQRGGDKVTFLSHEVGKPSDIAKHKGQGFSEGSLYFHLSASITAPQQLAFCQTSRSRRSGSLLPHSSESFEQSLGVGDG